MPSLESPASGEVMFARYAYPPNALGYCGPDDPGALLELASNAAAGSAGARHSTPVAGGPAGGPAAAAAGGDLSFRALATAFDGAWVYLEVIAAAAGLADPLDPRVVEAYWLGNELLELVDPAAFAVTARARFAAETGAHWAALDCGPTPSVPHHGFQVFTVYPWVSLLGRGDTALHVLNQCRIRWARVERVDGDRLQVHSQPLLWSGTELALGAGRLESVRWGEGGRSLLARPEVGDWVSLHWDWACDRLDDEQLRQLRQRTGRQLDITNRALSCTELH